MKNTLRIPTKESYAYIECEFEGTPDEAFIEYKRLTNLVNDVKGNFEEKITFTGETILYDKDLHIYTTLEGKRLLSGSAYKKSLEPDFPPDMHKKVGAKYGVDPTIIKEMWGMNSFCSSKFGDALHKAMELYRTHGALKDKLEEKQYFLPKNITLREAVLAFPETLEGKAELMISAIEKGWVGQIDWLTITGEKQGIVEDYKSDMEVKKNLAGHFNQLSFYAHILRHHGWDIPIVKIWNWDGKEWKSYESEVLPIKKPIKKQ